MSGQPRTRKAKQEAEKSGKPLLTAHSKRPRKATHYKLSEKDWPIIKKGLRSFIPIYLIANKIGCGYNTLILYINKTPELMEVRDEAKKAEVSVVEGQLMKLIMEGSFKAAAFYLERKGGWIAKQQFENIGPLPQITFGLIPENEIPAGLGEPDLIKGSEEKLPEAVDTPLPKRAEHPADEEDDEDADDEEIPQEQDDDDGWGFGSGDDFSL